MAKTRSRFREKLELIAVRVLLGGLGIFPLRYSMAIGRSFASALVSLFPRLSKTADRNLEIAFPEISKSEKRRIVKGTFGSLGRQLGFISHFRKFERTDIQKLIEIVGRDEHFNPAIESGRGLLFFTGHFGSWEVFNLLSPAFGYEMNILVRRIDNALVEQYVDSLRTEFGSITIGKKNAARRMNEILSKGGILGILADLNVQEREGVFVDFFGVKASTTTSIAKLALRTNAIIMPAFAVWDDEKRKYVVHLDAPIEYEPSASASHDIAEITQKITNSVEKYVRKYPEQWLWVHKRWNTRPKGEHELY